MGYPFPSTRLYTDIGPSNQVKNMNSKKITIAIELNANGFLKRATLDGCAFIDAGFLMGTLRETGTRIDSSEHILMTAFTFTGCPVAAREDSPGANPWRLTHGEYSAQRELTSDCFRSASTIVAQSRASGIHMDLCISYIGDVTKLTGVARPFQERIRQSRPGELVGEFKIPFLASGELLEACAVTHYHLAIGTDIPDAWRNITILPNVSHAKCVQIEQIDLFADPERASRDLSNKLAVAGDLLSCNAP